VADTGEGIAPEELEYLFEPFSQTTSGKKAQEGTGLGLTISRKFVQLMGGELKVQSVVNQGSIFSFEMQAQAVNSDQILARKTLANSPTPQAILSLATDQSPPRILIVDDHELNRELLVNLLQPIGFDLATAADGTEAISLWQSWQPDLILMDLRMPKLSGEEAIKIIKGDFNSMTKIITLTASTLETERAKIMTLGCDDFLRKPSKTDELLLMMTKHLGVCYTYAEDNAVQSLLSPLNLTDQAFEEISEELLRSLKQSIMEIDLDKIEQITQQIGQENELLAQVIEQYISNFEYEHILNLLRFN
jgi:CheY-like chemotaxis protein